MARGGVARTLLLLAIVALCLRLGFWQLDRLEQRRALNARIAARQQLAPLTTPAQLADTARSLYRRASLAGRYDVDRSIVLPGHALRGTPGVHLLTPFLLTPDTAVLVNRGWVPAADGATIPLDSLPIADRAIVGLLLPLPADRRSGGREAAGDVAAGDTFRRVWYRFDAQALAAQFPYVLLPGTVQLLPGPGTPLLPTRLAPPPLDQGPHLSYAIQWFAFATIGLVGWLALLRRSRRSPHRASSPVVPPAVPPQGSPLESAGAPRRPGPGATLLLAAVLAGSALLPLLLRPGEAAGQLRPQEPLDWRIFDRGTSLVAGLGASVLWDQTVPLAGSRGTLAELATYNLLWRSGRFGLEISGVALWRLAEDTVFRMPSDGVDLAPGGVRQDAGPVQVSTLLRLTPERWRTDVALRFGTRIPTTSDESGLDRDRTDFFALVAARWRHKSWWVAGETGLGINGTRLAQYPQSDVWTYSLRVQHQRDRLAAFAALTGHQDGHSWTAPHGNEDLAELRAGLRFGQRWWLESTYVHGLRGPTPRHGLRLLAGTTLSCPGDCLPSQ